MKWLLLLFAGFIVLTPKLYGQESISLFDIDTTNFPTIKAKFIAFDASKNHARPSGNELVVTENGIQRTITNVFCPPSPPPIPLSSVLTIDVSGSMLDKYNDIPRIKLAQIAAQTWVNTLDFSQNECAVTSFDDNNYLNQDFTSDASALLTAIEGLEPDGGTDYNKGLLLPTAGSLEITKRGKFRRVVVFLTDGYPQSDPNVTNIVNEAKLQGCTIFAVMIGLYCPQSLKDICVRTGGTWFENINSVGEALEVYNIILKRAQGIEPCSITWESAPTCETETRNISLKWNNGPSSAGAYIAPTSALVRLNIAPKSLYMNYKTVGKPFDTSVTVTAQKASVTVTNITSTNIQYDIFPKSFTLQAGASITLKVQYTPPNDNYSFTRFDFITDVCPLVLYASSGQKGKISPNDAIKLTKPNGSEVFVVGSDTVITWRGVPTTDIVRLEYSTDNGSSWIMITDYATGGRYEWKKIPNTPSYQCLVRVTQLDDNVSQSNSFPLLGHSDNVTGIRWSHNDKYVATASADSTMRIWDATTGAEVRRIAAHRGSVNSVEWSTKDDSQITTASADSTARIWDVATGNEVRQFKGHIGCVECATLSPDRSLMATASKDLTAQIWDANTGKSLRRIPARTVSITSVSWSPDAQHVATSRNDTRIFDATTGSEVTLRAGHTDFIDFMAWSPNGTQIATACRDKTARIWNASSGDTVVTFYGHTGGVNHLGWSPDGSKIATASADNTAQIWDALTGQSIQKFFGHTGAVTYVSWSPDGKAIATASADNTARIWDAATGKQLQLLKGHADIVTDVVWNQNGSRVATSSPDNTAWIWDVSGAFAMLSDVSDAVFSIVIPVPAGKDIDMHQVLVGSARDSLVESFVANKGSYAFKVNEIIITGPDSSNFSIISGIPPFDVLPNNSKSVEFHFAPISAGQKSATVLIITQNDTLRQTITGEGISPQIAVINSVIDFGAVEVKTAKDTLKAVTVKNIGNSPITITGTRYGAPNDKDFTTISGGGSFTLASGDSKEMDLKFIPSTAGRTSGQLLFDYNGTGSPAVIQLFGEGIAPKLIVVNDTIDFETVEIGTPKDTVDAITIKNIGTMALTINNVRYANSNNTEFTTIAGGGTFKLPPQESAKMSLRFTPNTAGIRSGKLLFDYNGTESPAEIVLIGNGVPKNTISVKVLNKVIDFGKVAVDSIKDSIQAVTIQNNGTVDITITDIILTNPSESSFTMLSNPTPVLLKTNDIIRLDLRFKPGSTGIKTNKLRFNYAGVVTPIEVELTGEGVNLVTSVELLTSEIDFGKIELGNYRDTLKALTIKNTGQTTVTVSDIENAITSELDFSIINNPSPGTLLPNETLPLSIRFTPSSVGTKSGRLRFNFKGSISPLEMGLVGEGIKKVMPTASALFTVGSAQAFAGEIVSIPITLNNAINIQQSGVEKFKARLIFNATLLEPTGTTPKGILQGNTRIINLDLPTQADTKNILLQLQFRAGLGNDSITAIALDSIEAIGGTAQLTHENGQFKLLGICLAEGARLLNPNGIITLSLIRPNPAHEFAEIELETTESGKTSLELYSVQGQKIRTFIDGIIEPACRVIPLDLQSVNSGVYILILQTPTERMNTILEVIR